MDTKEQVKGNGGFDHVAAQLAGSTAPSFKVLVAEKKNGAYQKVAVISPRKNGSFAVPEKMHGQLSALVARNAIRSFMADAAMRSQDVEIGSAVYRVTRF